MSSKLRVPEAAVETAVRLLKAHHRTFAMLARRTLVSEPEAVKRNAKRVAIRAVLEETQQTIRELGESLGWSKPTTLEVLGALTLGDQDYLFAAMDEELPKPLVICGDRPITEINGDRLEPAGMVLPP